MGEAAGARPDGRVLLEVCVASVADVRTACAAGADRIELNTALFLGGLTPSLGLVVAARQAATVPMVVMIRPRPGGFCYDDDELAVVRRDLDLAFEHGADAVAVGVLDDRGRVDRPRGRELAERAGPGRVVFHRAFDLTPDPFEALEAIVDLGIRRIMTSGQQDSAYQGTGLIARLIDCAAGRVEILPAGGINRFTVADVVARTGCDQVHASLRAARPEPSAAGRPGLGFGGVLRPAEDRVDGTSHEAVAGLRAWLDGERGTLDG